MIRKTATILLLAATAFSFTGIALAQDGTATDTNSAAPAQTSQSQTKMNALIKQLREKSAKLDAAYQKALKNNADLRKQQSEFVAMLRKAVKAQGYDIEAGQKRVQKMTSKIKEDDLSEDERKAIMQKFQAERQSLNEARSAALQQPKIKQAGQALQTATVAAMTAQNPEVEQLLKDISKLRQQIRAAAQQPAG